LAEGFITAILRKVINIAEASQRVPQVAGFAIPDPAYGGSSVRDFAISQFPYESRIWDYGALTGDPAVPPIGRESGSCFLCEGDSVLLCSGFGCISLKLGILTAEFVDDNEFLSLIKWSAQFSSRSGE
jgi:hypothetical protein